MSSISNPQDPSTEYAPPSPKGGGLIQTNDGTKHVEPLTSQSKSLTIALVVGTIVGTIIVIMGAANVFGTAESQRKGLIMSIGGAFAIISLHTIGGLFCAARIKEVRRVNIQSQVQAHPVTVYVVSDQAYKEHLTGRDHPEKPERITSINQALEQAGLKDAHNSLSPRQATDKEIELCHDSYYIALVESEITNLETQETKHLSTGDVVISQGSLDAARLAIGGVLTAVDHVFTNERSKAFCVVRPPGHHASCARGAGFCIFNNVAIAARYAQQKYRIKRVLIVDWDVHHGDGTQNIFYTDPSVFYFSTHEEGNYPSTGKREETGSGEGEGSTMNIPIPGMRILKRREGTGAKIIEVFHNKLTHAMESFQPEFVLISCGFDGHKDDPLGGFDLTNEDYATLTTCVNEIANKYAKGRVVSVLEGGYNLQAIAEASVSHVRALTET